MADDSLNPFAPENMAVAEEAGGDGVDQGYESVSSDSVFADLDVDKSRFFRQRLLADVPSLLGVANATAMKHKGAGHHVISGNSQATAPIRLFFFFFL